MTLTSPQHTELDRTHFFINGTWVEPRGTDTHLALEAATEQPLGTAAMGTDADIDAAVTAARAALDEGPWGRTTAAERAEVMHRFADALAARADTTSELVSRENGMPITLSAAVNGAGPVGLLQMYAELGQTGCARGGSAQPIWSNHRAPRTRRCRRRDNTVELPTSAGHGEGRTGARRRMHRRT